MANPLNYLAWDSLAEVVGAETKLRGVGESMGSVWVVATEWVLGVAGESISGVSVPLAKAVDGWNSVDIGVGSMSALNSLSLIVGARLGDEADTVNSWGVVAKSGNSVSSDVSSIWGHKLGISISLSFPLVKTVVKWSETIGGIGVGKDGVALGAWDSGTIGICAGFAGHVELWVSIGSNGRNNGSKNNKGLHVGKCFLV